MGRQLSNLKQATNFITGELFISLIIIFSTSIKVMRAERSWLAKNKIAPTIVIILLKCTYLLIEFDHGFTFL